MKKYGKVEDISEKIKKVLDCIISVFLLSFSVVLAFYITFIAYSGLEFRMFINIMSMQLLIFFLAVGILFVLFRRAKLYYKTKSVFIGATVTSFVVLTFFVLITTLFILYTWPEILLFNIILSAHLSLIFSVLCIKDLFETFEIFFAHDDFLKAKKDLKRILQKYYLYLDTCISECLDVILKVREYHHHLLYTYLIENYGALEKNSHTYDIKIFSEEIVTVSYNDTEEKWKEFKKQAAEAKDRITAKIMGKILVDMFRGETYINKCLIMYRVLHWHKFS